MASFLSIYSTLFSVFVNNRINGVFFGKKKHPGGIDLSGQDPFSVQNADGVYKHSVPEVKHSILIFCCDFVTISFFFDFDVLEQFCHHFITPYNGFFHKMLFFFLENGS